MNKNELVLFKSKDGAVTLPVPVESETVWLTQAQMAELFEKDRTVIGRHIRNAITEGEIDRQTMCAKRVVNSLDTEQVLDVVKVYSSALDLLDGYDHTLVALTVMIAESKPQEKELMVNLVMTFLK